MKALICRELGPAEKLVIEEMPDPKPGAGEVVVDVRAAGLNFPDTLLIEGKYQVKLDPPFTPGGEAAGVISAVGEGVKHLREGDRVIAAPLLGGAFAEKCLAPAASVIPVNGELSFQQAAGFSVTYATTYYALKRQARLRQGETLLVLGAAGGVGSAAVELGKAMGATVIAAASTEEKLDFAGEIGADARINYSTESLRDKVKSLTGGKGVDVVYDPVGGALSEQSVRALGWNGRFLVIGFASGEIPRIPLNLTLLKGASIIGVWWGGWLGRDSVGPRQDFQTLLGMVAEGMLKPRVEQVFPFEDYVDAFACLSERRARGKVILDMGQG
jgi:NADPH2:quinone reductase